VIPQAGLTKRLRGPATPADPGSSVRSQPKPEVRGDARGPGFYRHSPWPGDARRAWRPDSGLVTEHYDVTIVGSGAGGGTL